MAAAGQGCVCPPRPRGEALPGVLRKLISLRSYSLRLPDRSHAVSLLSIKQKIITSLKSQNFPATF